MEISIEKGNLIYRLLEDGKDEEVSGSSAEQNQSIRWSVDGGVVM